ncbi:hypothetical protein [Pinibacter soli]|uniref:Lipoprotein n=1 Tax=Pinibacter soli TaxID=3044211 RepID=A0ABT6RH19_9BACT|nr:hypothetical protein [Pinibacter soli]MDI3321860.1 hypothetical protein [Pinibacter soli]
MKQIFVIASFIFFISCSQTENPVVTPTPVNYNTTAFFISNKDTIQYKDSSSHTQVVYSTSKAYAITLGLSFRVISDSLQPKLYVGQQIRMPYMRYYGPYSDHGTDVKNDDIALGSGSTVVLTVTRVGSENFDATFSGKLWSTKDIDTLFIKEGVLKQVKMPTQ